MKIVYISNSIIPSREANAVNVVNICDALVQLGHQVILIAPFIESAQEKGVEDIGKFYGISGNLEIRHLPFPDLPLKSLIYTWFIGKTLRELKPDYVIGRYIPGVFAATLLRFSTTLDLHNLVSNYSRLEQTLFNRNIRSPYLKKITTNSNALRELLLNQYPIENERIKVAHNGAKDYGSETAELYFQNNNKVAGYFGHLYKGRGIEIIIELARRIPDLNFLIVGGKKEDLEFWRSKTDSISNLKFVGFIHPGEVFKHRNSCDFLLAPYQEKVSIAGGKYDTAKFMNPIKLFEYLSAGKAIIASDLAPIKEILNSKNAVLVSPSNVDEWENALIMLSKNGKLIDEISGNARRDFLENYTWEKRAEKLIN